MFQRLILADWTSIFTLVAFITAFSVFVTIFCHAIRMSPPQIERLARLPFADEPSLSRHDVE